VAQPVNVQQLLKYKQQTAVQQQKAIQPQVAQGQAAVQQKVWVPCLKFDFSAALCWRGGSRTIGLCWATGFTRYGLQAGGANVLSVSCFPFILI
jgi:hypothetical protein